MSQGTLVQTEESTFQPRKLAGKMCKSGLFCDKSALLNHDNVMNFVTK